MTTALQAGKHYQRRKLHQLCMQHVQNDLQSLDAHDVVGIQHHLSHRSI